MRVKKFQAATLPEALRAVKRELGPDAVIIHSHRVPQSGLKALLGKDQFEVVAAVDGVAKAPATAGRGREEASPPQPAPASRTAPPREMPAIAKPTVMPPP